MNSLYEIYKDKSQKGLDLSLAEACRLGDLEEVKFLLTSPDLMFNANIQSENNDPIFQACDYEHLEIVEYLLTSDELKVHADKYFALKFCLEEDKLEITNFLLHNPELEIDIHIDNDIAFELALSNKSNKVLHHLVFNFDINRTPRIESLLDEYRNDQVKNWFELRDVNRELSKELNNNNINQNQNQKKLKV